MAIREATTDDVESIQAVADASWSEDYPNILSRESIDSGLDEWYSAERIEDSIIWSRALMLVADAEEADDADAGEVVGFAHATWDVDEEEGNILRVYVHPAYRNEGIGGDLLAETRDRLFDVGVDRVKAMVLENNDLGKAFYEAFGFEQTETEEIVIGDETYVERTYTLEREP